MAIDGLNIILDTAEQIVNGLEDKTEEIFPWSQNKEKWKKMRTCYCGKKRIEGSSEEIFKDIIADNIPVMRVWEEARVVRSKSFTVSSSVKK